RPLGGANRLPSRVRGQDRCGSAAHRRDQPVRIFAQRRGVPQVRTSADHRVPHRADRDVLRGDGDGGYPQSLESDTFPEEPEEHRCAVQNRVTRRTFLEAGAAGAVFAAAGPALAQTMQQPPRAKGPRVWLDLDQKELDDAYDQRVYAPNQPQVTARYATNSEITRAR